MCKTRTIASKKHILSSLNYQFFCFSRKSPLKVPWRSLTLRPLGDLQETSPGRRMLAGKRKQRMEQIKVPCNFERLVIWMSPKQKENSCSTYYSLNVFLSIITYNFYPTVSKLQQVLSIFSCLNLFLRLTLAVLQKPYQENFAKFREFGESRFGGSENDRYFLKILKWQHKLVQDYTRGTLVSYFLNSPAKTCLHELKILENIEIEQMFHSIAFFHISDNLHTSCFSAFNISRKRKGKLHSLSSQFA